MNVMTAAALAALLTAAQPALAEPPGAGDQALIRTMILSQIDAFRADDGEEAFAFASPMIRGMFREPDVFMTMVRQGYPQVYRPREVAFGRVLEFGDSFLQEVFLVGPAGATWIAAYDVVQQDDGTWRINGVQIARDRKGEVL